MTAVKFIIALLLIAIVIGIGYTFMGGQKQEQQEEQGVAISDFTVGNTGTLAEYLVGNIEFKDFMAPVENSVFFQLYNLDETLITDATLYAGTGATAEEIAIITGIDEASTQHIKNMCEDRLNAQISAFADYVPEELDKLEDELLVIWDKTVIFIVCEDKLGAEKLLEEYKEREF